jgi:hypothetical protein
MGRLILPLKCPSPFAFPGGNAGFDPSHVAAGTSTKESVVCFPGGPVSLLSGRHLVKTGSPINGIDAYLGPEVSVVGTDKFALSGHGTATYLTATLAGFVNLSSYTSGVALLIYTNSCFAVGVQSSTHLTFYVNLSGVGSFPTMSLGVPYFYAGSFGGGTINMVLTNLLTGAITTATATTATTPSGFGDIWNFFSANSGVFSSSGSAAMVSNAALSLPQLLQWAADPWSFWYP